MAESSGPWPKPTASFWLATPWTPIPVFDGMAAAGDRLYMSTVDGRVVCLCRRQPPIDLPASASGAPERVAWDQPEDPAYLLPPEEPKEGDFDHVARCKIVAREAGVSHDRDGPATNRDRSEANSRSPSPAPPRSRLACRPDRRRRAKLRNGFLAFGDGVRDAKLIKCGARVRAKRALLAQGPLDGGKSQSLPIEFRDGQEAGHRGHR